MDAAKKRLAHGGRRCHRTGWNINKPPVLGKTHFFKTEVDVRLSFGFEEKKKNVSECPRFQHSRERVSLSFGFEEKKKKNLSECPRFEHSTERVSLSKKRSRSFVVDEFSCFSDKRNRVSDPSVVSKEEDIEEGEIVEDVLTSACNANSTTKETQSSETLITLSSNVPDSEPKSEIDENRALRAAMLKTRFADTILKAQEKFISTTKPGRSPLHQLEDKKARIITEIAAAKDLLKQHRETERKNEAALRQNALESKKKRIQKEREAFRKSLENMKNTANFVDGREIQREFELFVGAPVTQFKRFTRDSAEYHIFYGFD